MAETTEGMGGFGAGSPSTGAEEAKEQAKRLGSKARQQAMRQVNSRAGEVSSGLDKFAEVLSEAVEKLEDDPIASRIGGGAQQAVQRAADFMRDKSGDDIVSAARAQLSEKP